MYNYNILLPLYDVVQPTVFGTIIVTGNGPPALKVRSNVVKRSLVRIIP